MIKNNKLKSKTEHKYDSYKGEWYNTIKYYNPYLSDFTLKRFAVQGYIFNELVPIIDKILKEINLEDEK